METLICSISLPWMVSNYVGGFQRSICFFFQSNFNTGVLILLDEWKLLGHKSSSSSHKSPSKSSSSGHKSSSSGHKSSSSGHKSSSGGHKRERESSGDRHKKSPKKARKWTASVLRNIPAKKKKTSATINSSRLCAFSHFIISTIFSHPPNRLRIHAL